MRGSESSRESYINETFAVEDQHCKAIRKALADVGAEGVNVGPYEGRLLQLLIGLVGAKKVVEVGTLYGYSALWMARALPEDGQLICLEKDESCFNNANELLAATEVYEKIEILKGDAQELLREISPRGPFDMIFIDANKGAYPNYLDWAEANIRKGGLIVGDNTFLFGHVAGEPQSQNMSQVQIDAMKSFNSRLADPSRYRSVLIPTFEGMTVAQKLH